jgi:hypothetical protein
MRSIAILALEDAQAFSDAAGTLGEMTITYAGLEAPLAPSHPGMRLGRLARRSVRGIPSQPAEPGHRGQTGW